MSHLGDGVSDRFVDRALRGVATADVHERHVVKQRCFGNSKHFEAVTQYNDEFWPQSLDRIGEADQPKRHGFGDRASGIAREQHLDTLSDGQPVRFDLPYRHAELGRQMHAGDDELEFEHRGCLQFLQDPIKQPVFRTAARNHGNPASHGVPGSTLLGRFTTRASSHSALSSGPRRAFT